MDIDVAARNLNMAEARKLAALAALHIALGEIAWRRNDEKSRAQAAGIWEEAGAMYAEALRRF